MLHGLVILVNARQNTLRAPLGHFDRGKASLAARARVGSALHAMHRRGVTAAVGFDFNPLNWPKDVADAFNAIKDWASKAGSWIADHVGEYAKWLWDHDPIMQLASKVASGENVWQALKESASIAEEDIRIFGPYLAYLPGIGTAASMAIAAGLALANGKSITDIALATMRGAIPPGPALYAFDAADALIHGKSIEQAAIDALNGELEGAGTAVEAAINLAKGESVSEVALSALREELPDTVKPALDAGIAIAKGQRVQEALLNGIRAELPPDYQTAFDAARQIAAGKNVLDVAESVALSQVPANLLPYATLGLQIAHGGSVQDALYQAALTQIGPEYKPYLDAALALLHSDTSAAIALVKSKIPPGLDPSGIYEQAKAIAQSPESAIPAATSAATGRITAATGGIVALTDAVITVAKQAVPDDPLAQAAFQAGIELVEGRRVTDIAAEVAKELAPANVKDAVDKATKLAKTAMNGSLSDLGLEALLDALPDDARKWGTLAVQAIKNGRILGASIDAARNQIPPSAMASFDAAMAIDRDPREWVTDANIASLKALIPGDQDPGTIFSTTISSAGFQIPDSVLTAAKAGLPTDAASVAAFAKGQALVLGRIAQAIGLATFEQIVPAEWLDAYKKVRDFVTRMNPSEIALGEMRTALPPVAQHALDGAAALHHGAPPEEIAHDPATASAIANVLAYKKAIAAFVPPSVKVAGSAAALLALHPMHRDRAVRVGAAPYAISAIAVSAVSQNDLDAYQQAIEDIAHRRAALGAANKYKGEPLDPAFQAVIDARVAQLRPKPSSGAGALVAIAAGVGAIVLLARR
jgi:hypothetical protein